MTAIGPIGAWSIGDALVYYRCSDADDLRSIRRFLKRELAPETETPYIYIVPDLENLTYEGRFQRPAVTIRLVMSGPSGVGQAARGTYQVTHSVVVTAYGESRESTMTLAQQVWRLFHEGGRSFRGAAFRIPMWEYPSGMRLDRWMRVQRPTLSMGIDATDDEGKWSRPIQMRIDSPREREVEQTPLIGSVSTSGL
jgi:hypothetical protein